jgi:hypothetical protein
MDASAIIALCAAILVICSTIGGAAWMIRSAMATMADRLSSQMHAGQQQLHDRISEGDRESRVRYEALDGRVSAIDRRVAVVENGFEVHVRDCHSRPQ